MQFQSNPYIFWQLIPFLSTLGLGIYIQTRPRKKPEARLLALIMFAGAFWSLMDAIQLASPDMGWQVFWDKAAFLPILIIPTAWFFLAVRFTGFWRAQVRRVQAAFFVVPGLTWLALLTNDFHHLFYSSSAMFTSQGITAIKYGYGPLFMFQTYYSYALILLGVLFLGIALFTNIKKYGVPGYGLILGVLAPLIGNMLYLKGSLPAGFPDPTPIAFTITGITFAWTIFAGRILDVVSIAHGSIVSNLTTGILVLDPENRVADLNPAAAEILGLSQTGVLDRPIVEALGHDQHMLATILSGLAEPPVPGREWFVRPEGRNKTYELRVSGVHDKQGRLTGRMLQFTDVSRQEEMEKSLEDTRQTLTSILDTLKDYYFETDVQGNVTNINRAFYEHLGYSRKEDVIGRHFRHFTDRESVRAVFQNFSRVFATKETVEYFRYTYHTRDGKSFIGETTLSPIIEGDVVVGARGVLRNVTDRVMSEEMLRQAKEEVEARVEELSAINRIATISSHSLNLNSILETLCVELTRIFPVRNAGIALLTPNKESLEVVAFHSTDPEETSALGMLLPYAGNAASQEVIENKKTVVVQNSQEDPRMNVMADVSRSRGTKAIMIVPLMTRGNAIGTIGLPAWDPDHVFSDNDIKLAETIAIQIAAAIDNANLFAQTESALGVAERDLEIGRQIQSGFFPNAIPDVPGWEIAAHFEAARQVAGDFYDFFQFDNSNLTALVIADVCDKGVGAALFMVLFRSLLRAFSKTAIDRSNIKECLMNIVTNTNNYIASIHSNSNMFATVFFGILDPDSGILYYVNGGHEPPAILNKDGQLIQRLKPTGPAVGLFPDIAFKVEQIPLAPGDFLVGYTDGAMDARNEEDQSFSEARLLGYLQAPWTSMFSMTFELKNELHNFIKGHQQFDDITLISLRRKLASENEQHAICRIAHIDILGELREFVEAAARQCELTQDDAFAFTVAADEFCANIIKYGFAGRDPGYLSLFFEADSEQARLTIRDDGMYFPPDQAETPKLTADWQESKVGGLGIHMARQLMDSVSYSRMGEKGNQLVLEKKIQRRTREKETDQWKFTPVR